MISKKNILKFETRKQIYDFISENPGAHIKKISENIGLSKTNIIHHSKLLIKLDLIEERKDGNCRRLYAKHTISRKEKELIDLLRKDTPRRIFLYLLFSISFNKTELSKELNLSTSTLSYHIDKFLKLGIIEIAPYKDGKISPYRKYKVLMSSNNVSNEVYYRMTDREPIIMMYKFLIKNKDSFKDKELIIAYKDYLKTIYQLKINATRIGKLKRIDDYIDGICDLAYDLFQPPFCI